MPKKSGHQLSARNVISALGGRVELPAWAAKLYSALTPAVSASGSDVPARWWGNLPLDRSLDELFYLICGATGSGKSSALKGLLTTIVPTITVRSNQRMFISDPKNVLLSSVYGMGPTVPIRILTASDLRSLRIPLGKVVTTLARSKELAKDLFPLDPKDNAPFFSRAVRHLGSGVMDSLLSTVVTSWELRDLLLILESDHYLRQVLDRIPQTQSLLRYLAREDLWNDIQATIEDKTGLLKIVAAFWHRSRGEFVPGEWLEEESIVYLGGDPLIEEVMGTVRRLLFKVLSEDILHLVPSESRRVFLCIDEFQAFGGEDQPVPGAHKLATEGRDRGLVLIYTFQHINDIIALYKERAKSLIGQFGNVAILKANDDEMDAWSRKMLGGYRRVEWKVSYTEGRSSSRRGGSTSWSTTRTPEIIDRTLVPEGAFMAMEKASPRTGIQGYFRSAAIGIWRPIIGPEFVTDFLPPANPFVVGYDKRPAAHQYLEPFGDSDFDRLKLRPEDPETKAKHARQLERVQARLRERKLQGK